MSESTKLSIAVEGTESVCLSKPDGQVMAGPKTNDDISPKALDQKLEGDVQPKDDRQTGGISSSSDSSSSQRSAKKHKKSHKKDKDRKKHKQTDRSQLRHRSRSRSRRRKSSPNRDRKRKSRSRDDRKRRERERQRSKDRRGRDNRDRDNVNRSRRYPQDSKKAQPKVEVLPKEIPMPIQVAMPPIPGERRRRERSRSPRDYYKKNVGGNEGEFWDSFSWQPRINYTPNVSSSVLINTKKMRRLQITNVPLQMGLTENDINELVTKFIIKNYLNDNMNSCPVVNVEIFEADRSVAIELSSVEETCRVCKIEKMELFKDHYCRIIRLGDSIYGASIVTQAQTAAQAQAAALAAIDVIRKKTTNFSVGGGMSSVQSSTVLRVSNAVTEYMSEHLTAEQWQQYYEDLLEGFSQFGKIKHNWFVKKGEKMVGAEPGNLFVQYETKEMGEKAYKMMQDRAYDERNIKLFLVPEQIYQKHFKPQAQKFKAAA